jgi:indolepyruvate ferredoxin oxidoreductase alpha subunit
MSYQARPLVGASSPRPTTRPVDRAPFATLADALREVATKVVVVPGKPVDRLTDHLPDDFVVEATDEKSGFEHAVGLAFAGQSAATLFKGVGVSHAWDSITNAMVHGTVDGGSLVMVAADDPVAGASTVIVDSRALAATADIAVIEPCAVEHVRPCVEFAALMSRTVGEPVLIRYTPELGEMRPLAGSAEAAVDDELAGAGFGRHDEAPKVVAMPGHHRAHGMTKPGRHVHRERFSLPVLTALADHAGLVDEVIGAGVVPDLGRIAVIGFGAAWATVGRPAARARDLAGVGTSITFPLPRRLVELAAEQDTVIVVEDGRPVGEAALALALHDEGVTTRVIGRRSGALPPVGRLHVDDVFRAIAGIDPVDDRVPLWKESGKAVDPPYDVLFDAVHEVRHRHGVAVTTCVGTVIDLAGAPWHGVDLALSLGSSPAAAAGIAAGGRRAIARIGDYGLLHSGLNAYGQIQRERLDVLTVIVANGVSRRTGSQSSAFHPDAPAALDLLAELRARRAGRVRVIDGDRAAVADVVAALEAALADLPATLVIESGVGFARHAPRCEHAEPVERAGEAAP